MSLRKTFMIVLAILISASLFGCGDSHDDSHKEMCRDGIDNDEDFETDCEDADCSEYYRDEDDPDWQVDGETCNASDIGMKQGEAEQDTKDNFEALKAFAESDNPCSTLVLDGMYHLTPGGNRFVEVTRPIKIMGGGLHFIGEQHRSGFKLKPNQTKPAVQVGGSLILDSIKLMHDREKRDFAFVDTHAYLNRFHGTVDRVMIRNCEFNSKLFWITGVYRHYIEENPDEPSNHYAGEQIKISEIEDYSTRFNRITVKNCKGNAPLGQIDNAAVLDKIELIGNDVTMNSSFMPFHWATSNEIVEIENGVQKSLSTYLNWQGKSHAIIRNNHIRGNKDLMLQTSYYSGGFLLENKTVNYEDNIIEDIMIRTKLFTDPNTGEPLRKNDELVDESGNRIGLTDSTATYDAYLSSTQVIARNNTIKNVMAIAGHSSLSNIKELMKCKSVGFRDDSIPRIRRYENNKYIIEEEAFARNIDAILNGAEFSDHTSVGPMYVYDEEKKTKRKLNEEEKEAYIRDQHHWLLMNGSNLYDMQEVTISGNQLDMPGCSITGMVGVTTRNFNAIGNQIKMGHIERNTWGVHQIFAVIPYKYLAGNSMYEVGNQSLETNIEVRDNTVTLLNQKSSLGNDTNTKHMPLDDDDNPIPLDNNSIFLLQIWNLTDRDAVLNDQHLRPMYIDENNTPHLVEFKLGNYIYRNNIGTDKTSVYRCVGPNWWTLQCSQKDMPNADVKNTLIE